MKAYWMFKQVGERKCANTAVHYGKRVLLEKTFFFFTDTGSIHYLCIFTLQISAYTRICIKIAVMLECTVTSPVKST